MAPPNHSPKPINLLKYHRPKIRLSKTYKVPTLTPESKLCIRTLASYRRQDTALRDVTFPRSRCAAVLVALFVGRLGDLYVLLSRRSSGLRSYAGDTALPGGKVDPEDRTLEDTARREAFEEIGLPLDRRKVPLLCVLEPFLASNQTIVTPVVVLILDNTLRPILNAAEVASLFSHPLSSFLSSNPPFPAEPESLHVPYHSYVDFAWPSFSAGPASKPSPANTTESQWKSNDNDEGEGQAFLEEGKVTKDEEKPRGKAMTRAHRFLTGREAGGVKPVFGLTAAILIRVAIIGYNRKPNFDIDPPSTLSAEDNSRTFTPSHEQRIAYSMVTNPVFREAFEKEGIEVDWHLLRRISSVQDKDSKILSTGRKGRRTGLKAKL